MLLLIFHIISSVVITMMKVITVVTSLPVTQDDTVRVVTSRPAHPTLSVTFLSGRVNLNNREVKCPPNATLKEVREFMTRLLYPLCDDLFLYTGALNWR